MLKNLVYDTVFTAVSLYCQNNQREDLFSEVVKGLKVEKPRDEKFGDFAVNISFLAKYFKQPPVKIAQDIVTYIQSKDLFERIDVVQGFINFTLQAQVLGSVLEEIIDRQERYGADQMQGDRKILIEYVSANPTGPLHIGHGRWAVLGNSLENLLKFVGETVATEFYINDTGTQMQILGKSVWYRFLELQGMDVAIPQPDTAEAKTFYPGDYVTDIAQEYLAMNHDTLQELLKKEKDFQNPTPGTMLHFAQYAKERILADQKHLLGLMGVAFDCWYSEQDLHQSGKVQSILGVLQSLDDIYEKDDAVWLRSSKYFDDSDRVLRKSDGNLTYLTADIAYHYEKYQRGYTHLINIWGADHHGYIPRMKSAVKALGYTPESLEILLGQLVRIVKDGKSGRMGKRKTMVTLRDLVEEVGVDATRYWMIMKSPNTTLEFDVDLATSKTNENPVFYVQYAHARCCSVLRQLTTDRNDIFLKKSNPPVYTEEQIEKVLKDKSIVAALWKSQQVVELEATKELIVKLDTFKEVLKEAALVRSPHLITNYLQDLAACFHSFYGKCRILVEDTELMGSRLILVNAVKTVLKIGLTLVGVSAPQSM